MYNFKLVNVDTDSISICKQDGSPFTNEEEARLLKELNSLFPETVVWDDDGSYQTVVVLKAKNYILYDGKQVKIKGSALKATQKAPALKEFLKEVIDYIIFHDNIKYEDIIQIYLKYVKEIGDIKDIKRWAARKTISDKVLMNDRTNEVKLRNAIQGTEIVEGDRAYVYYTPDNDLRLVQHFDGNYNKARLYKNLYDTAWVFESILDCELLFKNYALKKNQKELEVILNEK